MKSKTIYNIFQRPFSVKFQNLSYVVMQPEIIDFKVTYDYDTESNVQYFSGYANIKKQLPHPFVHLSILMDSGNDNFNMVYINKTVSFCKFLKSTNINPLVAIFYGILTKYVDMPKQCPIVKVKITRN